VARSMSDHTVSSKQAAGIEVSGNATAVTSAAGLTAKALQVVPLGDGQHASSSACLNGTTQSLSPPMGARLEYALDGGSCRHNQSIGLSAAPAPIVLRVRDALGNPMAGGTVIFCQAGYGHRRARRRAAALRHNCSSVNHLQQSSDWTERFHSRLPPLLASATNVVDLASAGNTCTLSVAVEAASVSEAGPNRAADPPPPPCTIAGAKVE
jgi:hypothetical protein